MPVAEHPTATIREIAIALMAVDGLLADFTRAEEALQAARKHFWITDHARLWENGRHEGDCTKQPHSCMRCQMEEYEEKARALAVNEGFEVPA